MVLCRGVARRLFKYGDHMIEMRSSGTSGCLVEVSGAKEGEGVG